MPSAKTTLHSSLCLCVNVLPSKLYLVYIALSSDFVSSKRWPRITFASYFCIQCLNTFLPSNMCVYVFYLRSFRFLVDFVFLVNRSTIFIIFLLLLLLLNFFADLVPVFSGLFVLSFPSFLQFFFYFFYFALCTVLNK